MSETEPPVANMATQYVYARKRGFSPQVTQPNYLAELLSDYS